IFEFLPPLFPERTTPDFQNSRSEKAPRPPAPGTSNAPLELPSTVTRLKIAFVFAITSFVCLFAIVVLINRFPRMDSTANALRPRNSPAYNALDQIKLHLNEKREPLWLIVSSETEQDMARKLDDLQPTLNRAVSNNLIGSFTLPTPLWPRPEFQAKHKTTGLSLAKEQP